MTDQRKETLVANINETIDKFFWFVNGNRIGIVEKNENNLDGTDKYISPSVGGQKLRLEYTSRPIPFDADITKSSELPDQFHEALAYKVIAELYRLPGESLNLQLAQYYDQLYMLEVREGKKYASRNKVSGGYIKPVSY